MGRRIAAMTGKLRVRHHRIADDKTAATGGIDQFQAFDPVGFWVEPPVRSWIGWDDFRSPIIFVIRVSISA